MSLHILDIMPETILDGEGIRYSIYLAGCSHHCPGCHNPQSHDPDSGELVTPLLIDKIVRDILDNPLLDGVTFSGGDPLYNPREFLELVKEIKERTQANIWCYTGYTIEYLSQHEIYRSILSYVDVLVDGRFIRELFDPHLDFRGSSNQRIIYLSEAKTL